MICHLLIGCRWLLGVEEQFDWTKMCVVQDESQMFGVNFSAAQCFFRKNNFVNDTHGLKTHKKKFVRMIDCLLFLVLNYLFLYPDFENFHLFVHLISSLLLPVFTAHSSAYVDIHITGFPNHHPFVFPGIVNT